MRYITWACNHQVLWCRASCIHHKGILLMCYAFIKISVINLLSPLKFQINDSSILKVQCTLSRKPSKFRDDKKRQIIKKL